MMSDFAEAVLESFAQAPQTSPLEVGSTAREGGAPILAAMGGGPTASRTPREVGPSSGARGTMEQPPTVEDAAAPVPRLINQAITNRRSITNRLQCQRYRPLPDELSLLKRLLKSSGV